MQIAEAFKGKTLVISGGTGSFGAIVLKHFLTTDKQVRSHFGITQEKFAKIIGKSSGFISNVELGKAGMSDDTIQTISDVFGIDEVWLKSGAGEMFQMNHLVGNYIIWIYL